MQSPAQAAVRPPDLHIAWISIHSYLKEFAMMTVQSSPFLRRVLLADAFTCIATGLLMLLGAHSLESVLGLPAPFLQKTGLVLLPIAAFIGYVGTRASISRRLVWVVIAGNALWVLDSIALLMSGWVMPTALGQAFIVVQAVAVAVLAELEYIGLRRTVMVAA
jgi:hypothetical protein